MKMNYHTENLVPVWSHHGQILFPPSSKHFGGTSRLSRDASPYPREVELSSTVFEPAGFKSVVV